MGKVWGTALLVLWNSAKENAMWVRELVRIKERYSNDRLPKPFHHMARVGWKIVGKPILKIALVSLARRQNFTTSPNWEWKINLLLGFHEEDTVKLCRRLIRPGMTVVDAGAHVGYFTRLFAELVESPGKVYAFEPNPYTFALLKKNTEQLSNVVLINKGLSTVSGQSRLFLNKHEFADSLFLQNDALSSIQVELISLDQFWNQVGRPNVDFIKMDVEGAEPCVLKGAVQFLSCQKKLNLVTEFRPVSLRAAGIEPVEFLNLLSALDFRYAAIGSGGGLSPKLPRIQGGKYVNLFCEKMSGRSDASFVA
jgi:FkbM family methyltransferase